MSYNFWEVGLSGALMLMSAMGGMSDLARSDTRDRMVVKVEVQQVQAANFSQRGIPARREGGDCR